MAKKKITDLKFDDKNFNIGSQQGNALLEKSIQKFGFREAATVDKNGVLIGGNKRTAKAGELGFEDVEIIKADPKKVYALQYDDIDIDTPEGRSLALALNATAKSNIVLDAELVEAELGEAVCEEWGVETSKKLEAEEDDFNGVPPKKPITVLGDLYELNEHRLHCADSCDSDAVAKLMNGKKADMVFTDPPYGIAIVAGNGKVGGDNEAKNGVYSEVIGDNTTDTAEGFYQCCVSLGMDNFIIWGGNYFTSFLPFSKSWIIWDKRGDMNSNNFADGEMAWCSFDTRVRIYKQIWNGMIREGEKDKRVHPTQKPVKMLSDIINDQIKGEIIFDGFLGSGSTLIASDQLNRICYGQELDPKYCDVIVARYIKHRKETGSSLVIKRNGQQLSEDEINKYIENTHA